MQKPLVILASTSPRRSALLQQIHIPHRVQAVDIDESQQPGETPAAYVDRLAAAKAESLWQRVKDRDAVPVLGADTTVALGDAIFGKPRNREDGLHMLAQLSGRTHRVYTAVALCSAAGVETRLSVSEVSFRDLSPAECAAYWETGEPRDKAGGYAVQGLAAVFIIRIAGSYSGIMGLPLAETAELLARIGWGIGSDEKRNV